MARPRMALCADSIRRRIGHVPGKAGLACSRYELDLVRCTVSTRQLSNPHGRYFGNYELASTPPLLVLFFLRLEYDRVPSPAAMSESIGVPRPVLQGMP